MLSCCRFEKLHPRPEWASLRTRAGHPSLSLLLSSTKSFIDSDGSSSRQEAGPSTGTKPKRGPLPPGEVKIQKLRNANYQNPTTGKREAKGAGHGVVDLAWHPSTRLSVLAVCGGDRRVRIFNVSPSAVHTWRPQLIGIAGRWRHEPSVDDATHPVSTLDKGHVPPFRIFPAVHRSATLLLHLRPRISALPPIPSEPVRIPAFAVGSELAAPTCVLA